MIEGWGELSVADVFNVQNGHSFRSMDFVEESYNTYEVLKMGHIQIGGGLRPNPKKSFIPKSEKLLKWVLNEGDIVMGMTDMKDNVVILGVPAVIDKDNHYVLNQRVARLGLRRPDAADNRFMFYQLKGDHFLFHLRKKANSGVQVNLSTAAIKESVLSLPPLPEQKAIAGVLSSLDDKIDLLHRQNKTLEALAETLFRQWFIIDAEDDWEERPLDKVADYLNGLACQKFPPKNKIARLPVLKIKDLRSGISDSSDWASTDIDSKYIIQNGDVIFSWSASLLVKIWTGETCILNQHLFKVTSEEFPKWFIYLWTTHHLARFKAIAETKSTTMGHIKRGDLSASMVTVPSADELSGYNEHFAPIFDRLIENNTKITTLEKLRDTLLPKLISGEVRIRSVEVT